MIEEDYLQARLNKDWEDFGRKAPSIVTKTVPRNNRVAFRDEFRKLQKAGCREGVLFACLYVFLNSRKERRFPWSKDLTFPWGEDVKAITSGLDRVRKKMEKLGKWSGFSTLMNGDGCWDFGLDLDDFAEFRAVHEDLLGTMDRYVVGLEDLRRSLPRKDIAMQYGQAVIWTYVSLATQLSFGRTSSSTQSLLDCCESEIGATVNWVRDIKRFQNKYPLFWTRTHAFLSARHRAATISQTFDWKRLINKG